ncbi:F-box protein CPR1-like [Lycium ferocissimum]|uniref:F-box protein CPR1-like n=1 Tax=Lycium ferocissimum TaxID=112874 RepID=UPI002814B0FD|nr:F-box protein CPR1-like [Lycium ferocissimum]
MNHSKKTKQMNADGAMGMHLQEEITMDILSRLPVQSLLRFKCVSKFWMTLISEPYFMMKHLHHAKNNQNSQKILVLNGKFSLYCSSLSSVQLAEDVHKLDWPSSGKPWRCKIYGCYDGLAFIGFHNCPDTDLIVLLLWNPSTRESIALPPPEFPPEDFCTWGLGYDSTSDDYKILKIDLKAHSEILALKSGSWRKIDKHPTGIYPVSLANMDTLAFVHGAFHWLGLSLKICGFI